MLSPKGADLTKAWGLNAIVFTYYDSYPDVHNRLLIAMIC